MICVKVKLQNLTRNLAGTWLKAKTVCGWVPFQLMPIMRSYRSYRQPRLGAGPPREGALGQSSAQTIPRTMHRGSGLNLQSVHGPWSKVAPFVPPYVSVSFQWGQLRGIVI